MRIIICDDEQCAREEYAAALRELAVKHDIPLDIVLFESGKALLFEAQSPRFSVDAIYMDIRMPGLTGDETSRQLRELGYKNEIVFLTLSEQHFLSAFDVDALHYIVKGKTSPAEFERIFMRLVNVVADKSRQYVLFTAGGESRNIEVSSIQYFEVYKKIITVHYCEESFEFYSSLEKLENHLGEMGFYRIHKSYLVALSHIASLTAKEITLRSGKKLPVSRKSYAAIKMALSGRVSMSVG